MTDPEFPVSNESHQLINFHIEDISFNLDNETILVGWLKNVINSEQSNLVNLNFIFCSDSYLHKINLEYLNHDTFTDVITFPYSEDAVEGDIFISVDRVRENASNLKLSFDVELYRVMVHGLLHLLHYADKTDEEVLVMRNKENAYLELLNGMKLDS